MAVQQSPKAAPLSNASDFTWWQSLNPELKISDRPFNDVGQREIEAGALQRSVRQLLQDGYFQLAPLVSKAETDRLVSAIRRLVEQGIPPVFGFVYDEFWQLFASLSDVFGVLLGGPHRLKPADIWIWYVDGEQAGWAPHRDQPVNTLQPNGRPGNLTVWIPLTDADPLNGCLYVLPTSRDRNVPDNLRSMKLEPDDLQNVRALPARAGSVLGWNPMIMHWGSRSSEWAEQPRVSMAVYVEQADYDDAVPRGRYASEDALVFDPHTELSFDTRLEAIRAAMRLYRHKVVVEYADIADELLRFADGTESSPARNHKQSKLRQLFGVLPFSK